MSNLSVFDFEGYQVRFVGTAENPEWVAADVATVLGIQNIRQNLASMEAYQKGVRTVYTPGGNQQMATVTEAGLYALIFTSRKESAKRFQRWVFEEVLPSIRKTGTYNKAFAYAWTERLKIFRRHTKIPTGWFCIFEELNNSLVGDLEDNGIVLPGNAVPDISVGRCFCSYLRSTGRDTANSNLIRKYPHRYPDGREAEANIYVDTLLPEYRRWFGDTYRPQNFVKYLKGRDASLLPTYAAMLGLPEGSL